MWHHYFLDNMSVCRHSQEALTAEAKPRRRARLDRLKAKRIAKQKELAKQGISEEEWRERDADLTRMEELDAEVR